MSRTHSHRRSRKGPILLRSILILLFVAIAVYAGYHCLFRAPEQSDQPFQKEDLTPEEQALQSHLERKRDFFESTVVV